MPPSRSRTRRPLAHATAVGLAGLTAATGLVALPSSASAGDPLDLRRYYRIFDRGGELIPGKDTWWVPQGLAARDEHGTLYISYYDGSSAKQRSRVAIIDARTGAKRKILILPTKGHVGGLAMSAGYLWVADGGRLLRIPKSRIDAKRDYTVDPTPLKAAGRYKVAASSTVTISGRSLWVAKFVEPLNATSRAYRYDLDARERPSRTYRQSIPAPSRVQGLALSGDKIVWSRSWGRFSRSRIEVSPRSAPLSSPRVIIAPNMSQGVVVTGGELRVLYESGSAKYGNSNYRVKTVHRAPIRDVTG